MFLSALLVHCALSVSMTTVAVAPVDALGFDQADVPAVSRAVAGAVVAAGLSVAAGASVDEACARDAACVRQRLVSSGQSHLLQVTVLRVGSDVEASDVLYQKDGGVVARGSRVVPVADFLADPLSGEVVAALKRLLPSGVAVVAPARGPTLPSIPSKGVVTAVAGGVLAAVGVVGFALEASVLEDPTASGDDKNRALVAGWLSLGVAAVGLVSSGAGVAWAIVDPAPLGSPSAAAPTWPAWLAPLVSPSSPAAAPAGP
jgi:hypothetical protein